MKLICKILMLTVLCLVSCSKDDPIPDHVNSRFYGDYSGLYTIVVVNHSIEQSDLTFTIVQGSLDDEIKLIQDGESITGKVQGDYFIFESQTSEMDGVTYTYSGEGEYYIDPTSNSPFIRLDFYSTHSENNMTTRAHGFGNFKKN